MACFQIFDLDFQEKEEDFPSNLKKCFQYLEVQGSGYWVDSEREVEEVLADFVKGFLLIQTVRLALEEVAFLQ